MVTALRLRALARAATKIGIRENPLGSNHGTIIDAWGRAAIGVPGGFPWCACFVWNMFHDLGDDIKGLAPGDRALVVAWVQWADRFGFRVKRPLRGDLVAYSWNGATNDPRDHIGFVEKVLALPWPRNGWRFYIRTVEGNVDEGVVRRKWRWVDPFTVAFIRVRG